LIFFPFLAISRSNFRIKRLPAREMIQAVKSGQFELGVGPFQKSMDALKSHKLFEETSLLVTSKENKFLKIYKESPLSFLKETVLLASFLDEPALRPSKTKIRDYFKAAWEIDSISMQIKLVNMGIGATYIPKTILDRDPSIKNYLILDKIPFYKVSKPYGIYHREDVPLTDGAKAFIKQAQNSN
jgi:DNA-binding transcriptional LysR family regulator